MMDQFDNATEGGADDRALRRLAIEPLRLQEARLLRGSGWDGDLAAMRSGRSQWS